MSIESKTTRTFVVVCDGCQYKSRHVYEGLSSPNGALDDAASRGWFVGGVQLCKVCQHANTQHWRQHHDACNAARAEAYRHQVRFWVRRCTQCGLWTIGADDE